MPSRPSDRHASPRHAATPSDAGRRPSAGEPAPVPQLVLMVAQAGAGGPEPAMIEAALSSGPVAALVLSPEPADERTQINRVKQVAPRVQAHGTALMVAASIEVAVRGGADGVHVAYARAAVEEAVSRLAPARMVGVAGLRSRDDAMTAGECGCHYVMFGEPALSRREGTLALPPFAAVVDRVAWWAELFEVPVIGYAPDLAGVAALAGAGADFVALGDAVWSHAEGPAAAVRMAHAALASGARA